MGKKTTRRLKKSELIRHRLTVNSSLSSGRKEKLPAQTPPPAVCAAGSAAATGPRGGAVKKPVYRLFPVNLHLKI